MNPERKNLVTILMTNYNDGRFIEDAVKSVVGQTYNNLEMIIIDDGSTDNSKETIEKLKLDYKNRFTDFKAIYLGKNAGINHALNLGIPLINGDIAIILDADDELLPSYVAVTTKFLLQNKSNGVGFVYTDNTLIDKNGDVLIGKDGNEVRLPWYDFNAEFLETRSYIPGCAATFTDVLKTALPLDESIMKHTKYRRWKKIVGQGHKGMRVNEQLARYRMHDENNSGIGGSVIKAVASGETVGVITDYWKPT